MGTSFTRLAERGTVSAYLGGEFLFGGKRRRGALLISPAGIYDWSARASLDEEALLAFLDAQKELRCDFLLVGTGPNGGSFVSRL